MTGYDDDRTRTAARWRGWYMLDVRGWQFAYHWARIMDGTQYPGTMRQLDDETAEIWSKNERTNSNQTNH